MKATLTRLGRSLGVSANRALAVLGLRLVRAADGGVLELSEGIGEAPMRVDVAAVEDAIHTVQQRFPDRQTVLLIDERQSETPAGSLQRAAGGAATVLVCSGHADPAESLPPLDQTAFVYACDLDSVGLPFIRHIVEGGGVFFAVPAYQVARYSHVDETARQVSRGEYLRQKAQGFDKFDLGDGDFLNLMQLIRATRDLPGAYMEIGCFRGSGHRARVPFSRCLHGV